ncbi:alpha/beta hydrolase [Phanerochaete sordida]|uniref:Alpha/beta hydrolase n=1 Tax=Phanerochaete sordida TaxID=48140 RepID=A0A9P3GB29_9APHY|nr:alpha/beta hydrolase [Phanerochaete sordida]
MVNALTRQAGIQLGPLLLETLVKHYFDRLVNEDESQGRAMTKLRQEELLYDEAFNVVKTFLEASTKHTVEELQKFSNTRTPSPPSVHVLRLLVPMSSCDEAARILIQAFGGEEMTKKIVGGTKWWQVRGVKGVDAEWIAAKKDWREAKRRYKAAQERERQSSGEHSRAPTTAPSEASSQPSQNGVPADSSPHYQPEMDEMRCILYAHGGGYYFGSVDQERYSIQRYARKINGRVFAINYRLAPQYPFPCALQDLIAAYLFLIRPPEDASHQPVNPAHLVVAGDSAGGGLTLALLQVIRDCGLPMPAGAVLVSPWCDLTHSFPSIHTNTATDVLPPYGLSFYKPSTLWPPPSDELNTAVRERLRTRIRQAISLRSDNKEGERDRNKPAAQGEHDLRLPDTGRTLHLGSTASLPTIQSGYTDQTVTCTTKDGETLTINQQIHLYAPNYLLTHPLISPVVSYLGGLCPLFVIAGDAEVLRDEIIYAAHKAADPAKYPVTQEVKDLYPVLNGIEERYSPTQVHLQVYDDAAHVLPILFSFTTPAKYCFRATATFIRHVTGMLPPSASDSVGNIPITLSPPTSPGVPPPGSPFSVPIPEDERLTRPSNLDVRSTPASREPSPRPRGPSLFALAKKPADDSAVPPRKTSLRRAFSAHVSRAGVLFRGGSVHASQQSSTIVESPPSSSQPPSRQSPTPPPDGTAHPREDSDVAGPRFYGSGMKDSGSERRAGEQEVYQNGLETMIRERVSTHGIIRPLEPESELPAFSLPPELIGVVSELAVRRYHDAKAKFDKKFSSTVKTIEKHRRRNLDIAHRDAVRNMAQLQHYVGQGGAAGAPRGIAEGLKSSGSWSWAWALDADERPPPSSIVARRDTSEAVELARIADQAVLADEDVVVSGNNLWQLMVNFLTTSPEKRGHHHHAGGADAGGGDSRKSKEERIRSRFAQLVSDHKKHAKAASPTVGKAPGP